MVWSDRNPSVKKLLAAGFATVVAAGAACKAVSDDKGEAAGVTVARDAVASVTVAPSSAAAEYAPTIHQDAALVAPAAASGNHASHYVSPSGTSGGIGTATKPWDLKTALSGGRGKIQPGDTVWLRGGLYRGHYRSTLVGTASRPVVVRQYPGERATIDGLLRVEGSNATYWGFELMRSDPMADDPTSRAGPPNLYALAPGGRYVNLVIHDAGENGISFGSTVGYTEAYGCIVYNNGNTEHLDHGIYSPSDSAEKWIVDNVFFNNIASGIQVYGTANHPQVVNVHVVGNISFNNGAIAPKGMMEENLNLGGALISSNLSATDNMLYFAPGAPGHNLRVGYEGRDNRDVVIRGNYVVGGHVAFRIADWRRAVVEDNTFIGDSRMVRLAGADLSRHRWHGNTFHRDPVAKAWYYEGKPLDFASWRRVTSLGATDRTVTTPPRATKVFVRPNKYEPGRAHIAIYNWAKEATVAVDVSGILRPGDRFELRNVQDVFGPPVANGTYAGGRIRIPMGGVHPPPAPGRPAMPPRTAPDFDVFLLTRPSP